MSVPKSLTWRREWSSHIDALDEEHRALFNAYADVCQRFGPEAAIGDAAQRHLALMAELRGLGDACREHFSRSQDFMVLLGYAGVGEHQRENALLMAEFAELLREWERDEIVCLDELAQGLLRDWLLAHILGVDRDFADAYFQLQGERMPEDLAAAIRQLHARVWSSRPLGSSPEAT